MDRQNEKMEIIYDRDQRTEDVQRISDILNRKTKKGKNKSPYLRPSGGIDLIEIQSKK
ncbi:hypothetical protein ES708_20567 [subsurface metagenome]